MNSSPKVAADRAGTAEELVRDHDSPENMRRILMLSYEYPPLGGGIGVSCQNLLHQFASDPSIAVDLITSGAGSAAETLQVGDRIRVLKLPVGKKNMHFWTAPEIARWTWGGLRLSRQLAEHHDYDLAHCWGGWPSGLLGYRLRNKFPYIVGLRGSDVPGYNIRLRFLDSLVFAKLSRRVWGEASAVVALSENLKSLAQRTAREVPIEVIRNGVDVARFKPGVLKEPLTFLYVGRLIERKGLFNLLEAFDDLIKTDPNLYLTLVGDGPDRGRMESYCKSRGLDGKVKLAGRLSQEQLLPLYREASVFVMPSLEEALGNAVLEAMAAGLPIVTTPTGARELLDGNGLVVERGDSEAMLAALERYAREPDLRLAHGARSRELAESMSWEATARAYRETYERVLDPKTIREV